MSIFIFQFTFRVAHQAQEDWMSLLVHGIPETLEFPFSAMICPLLWLATPTQSLNGMHLSWLSSMKVLLLHSLKLMQLRLYSKLDWKQKGPLQNLFWQLFDRAFFDGHKRLDFLRNSCSTGHYFKSSWFMLTSYICRINLDCMSSSDRYLFASVVALI